MKYQIHSKAGADFGVWEGSCAAEAWARMVSDGCGTPQDPADRSKGTWDVVGTVDDWIVEEYTEAPDLSDAEADYIDAERAASEARALDTAPHD